MAKSLLISDELAIPDVRLMVTSGILIVLKLCRKSN